MSKPSLPRQRPANGSASRLCGYLPDVGNFPGRTRGDALLYALVYALCSYQAWERLTMPTTSSMTGTSISTPTTVASAAPERKPNWLIAVATASSKKLEAPIKLDGPATQCATPSLRLSRYASPELRKTWIRIGTVCLVLFCGCSVFASFCFVFCWFC